jgi:hypothetical protein
VTRTRRSTRLLLGVLLVAVGLGICVPVALDLVSNRIVQEVEQRLGLALGGSCRVGRAQLLSRHDVALQELACVMDSGPLLGIASRTFSANFEEPLTTGRLSPIRALAVDGLEVRLRELPALPGVVQADPDPAQQDAPIDGEDEPLPPEPTERVESVLLRFLELSQAINRGRGGSRVAGIRDRMATSSTIRVDNASVSAPDGSVLLRNLHGQISRMDEQLGLAVALQLAGGGIVSLDGTLTEDGLDGARVRLERLPVADAMNELLGDRLSVREAMLSASLRHIGWARDESWQMEAGLDDLTAGEGALGASFVTLPPLRLEGTLISSDEGTRLSLEKGRWEVAGIGGNLFGEVGPLGSEETAHFQVTSEALQLPLGKLLSSLPEQVMPHTWSEEITGTMDMSLGVSGALHQRDRWSLDWSGDFSRMVLASGELASQVERLHRPFEHTFAGRGEGATPTARLVGGHDPHFAPLRQISSHLVNAVVSTEDAGFFGHSGFSTHELKEAMLENLREGGGRGGSTITQQLAKNLFLSGERTLARKLQEGIIAWRMESDLPKERILEIYLNIAEWGPGLYGIRDAADHYFGRSPRVLRPEEAAFLASLLPSPRRYHGYYHERGVTRNRQALVQDILHTMHRMGRLQRRAFLMALDEPIEMIGCSW